MPDLAWAMAGPQGSAAPPDATPLGYLMQFAPLIMIFVVFYFLLIRPQQKKQKEIQNMLDSLKKGDKVITSGGLVGVIADVKDKRVVLRLGEGGKDKEGVKVEVLKNAIISLEKD